jgi:hypothetical protein
MSVRRCGEEWDKDEVMSPAIQCYLNENTYGINGVPVLPEVGTSQRRNLSASVLKNSSSGADNKNERAIRDDLLSPNKYHHKTTCHSPWDVNENKENHYQDGDNGCRVEGYLDLAFRRNKSLQSIKEENGDKLNKSITSSIVNISNVTYWRAQSGVSSVNSSAWASSAAFAAARVPNTNRNPPTPAVKVCAP